MRPDPAKVKAIKDMPTPESKEDVQTFLGMATYLSPFIRDLADKSHTLRGLMKKETPWTWDSSYDTAFRTIKEAVSADACVRFYDVTKPVTLEVDASLKGLGAALLQDGRPVAFASKALTSAETRYSNTIGLNLQNPIEVVMKQGGIVDMSIGRIRRINALCASSAAVLERKFSFFSP